MTDIEIAKSHKPQPIEDIARSLGIGPDDLVLYGKNMAKIETKAKKKQGKLILVTAINPTKAGIGKTTVSIGLADAFSLLGEKVCLALREPSLGPVFGIKGGATGGGFSQVVPMEDINLHFTGDFHAITSANNLLCSYVDNHIFQGNELEVDESKIFVKRCLDINERELRDITLNKSGRRTGFVITAASEVMAVLSVASNLEELKLRLGNIFVALNKRGEPLYAKDFGVHEAMAILLKEAIKPNLVQTLGKTPAIVHCGPFANIAHGCNSIVATRLALSKADYTVTEAGFGADLGAEKFLNYKCRLMKDSPDAVVLVCTLGAIKMHGTQDGIGLDEKAKIEIGVQNVLHHYNVLTKEFGLNVVIALNRYVDDKKEELDLVKRLLGSAVVEECDVWAKGGKGATLLAAKVKELANKKNNFKYTYDLNAPIKDKVDAVVKKVYGGRGTTYTSLAESKLKLFENLGFGNLPIIIAKTQFSLSDNKNLVGVPKDFLINVTDVELHTGAGYITIICGNMMLLPALSKTPAGLGMKIDKNGNIEGLF